MKLKFLLAALLAGLALSTSAAAPKPLRALLFAGGCCHDYAVQHLILKEGLEARAHVEVEAIHSFDRSTKATFAPYEKPDWAKGYDVIVHDECSADVKDVAYVNNILAAHRAGIPAVNLHCAMHSYRVGNISQPVVPGSPDALWFDLLGLQSTGHGPQEPIQLTTVAKTHPIMAGLPEWTTGREELYNNVKIFPSATPLMRGKQVLKQKDGSERAVESVVTWVNEYGPAKTRVFSSTVGHNNDTVADPRYLDLVTRGLLWSCDKLNATYTKPAPATTATQQVASAAAKAKLLTPPPAPEKPAAPAKPVVVAPIDGRPNLAVAGTAKASSEESGKGNYADNAIDGDSSTRWCASGGGPGHTFQVDLGKEVKITGVHINWESKNNTYRYRLEASADGQSWQPLADAAKNDKPGATQNDFPATSTRHIRLTYLGSSAGGWGSFWEFAALGEKGATQPQPTAPAAGKKGKQAAKTAAKELPILPSVADVEWMKPVYPDKVAGILAEVKAAEGFEVKVFATPPAVNYPVFVAAAADGTVFVSSDGNGSLGRLPNLGRILRVRDTNGDGEADEVKVFVPNVDSPRGLLWDHDRVICLHPPHVSAFIDRDGDGHADDTKMLIKGIAFGFKDRPADHTSNGIELGVDGWIYAAIGDFGFMEAEGTDGRKLQLRAGGIVRFRPDGTGLHLFARGTRNILEAAVSPELDSFARDNTNDGGGWDVRFHHFSGLEEHGYPSLYKNFADELIAPLADYGGGSGCGAAWIAEPGFPAAWGNAPFTADWGRGVIYRHAVKAKGATFAETEKPAEFLKLTRPTDLDVDASSRVYAASWKGATFNWAGMDVGYLVRVTPKGFQAPALPDFAKATDADLVKLLENPSHRVRLEAQRTLIRRSSSPSPLGGERAGVRGESSTATALSSLAADKSTSLPSRIAALFALTQSLGAKAHDTVAKLTTDSTLAPWALRALTDDERTLNASSAAPVLAALKSPDARTRKEALVAAGRIGARLSEPQPATNATQAPNTPQPRPATSAAAGQETRAPLAIAALPLLTDPDPVVAHTAMRALIVLRASDACLAAVDRTDSPSLREAALRVLRLLHEPKVVDALLARLAKESDFTRRQGLLTALARLHFLEGKWTGTSWGTRPDTRGPYFQPEEWSESKPIADTLTAVMAKADAKEAVFLAGELNRHRLEGGASLDKLLALAQQDASVEPVLVQQLARAQTVPPGAHALLVRNASADATAPAVRAAAVTALAKSDLNADTTRALLTGVAALRKSKVDDALRDAATEAFLNSTFVEKQLATLTAEAAKAAGDTSLWADTALLRIHDRQKDKQKSKAEIAAAFDAGWAEPKRRAQLIEASVGANKKTLAPKILAAVSDADKAVAATAKKAVDRLKLETGPATGPLVGTLKVDAVLAAVMNTKGTVARGQEIYAQLGCANCHTVSPSEPARGPILSQVATIYKRRELAEAILIPSKSIAQGFAANRFVMKDGETEYEGFVISEAADKIIARLVTAQEIAIKPRDIAKRQKLEKSLMPDGLAAGISVTDLASLVDYLEGLAHGGK